MIKNKNKIVYLAAVIFSIITGLSYFLNKVALETSEPIDILAHRFTSAFLGLLIGILFGFIKVNLTKEKIKKILPLALFNPLLYFGLQTTGLQYATSAEGGILLASSPIFTLLLASYFLKEKSTLSQKIFMILSVSGVVYITIMKGVTFDFNNILGVVLLLLSAISIASYNVVGRVLNKNFSNMEISFVMISISFIIYNIIAIVKHIMSNDLLNYFTPFTNIDFTISVVYLGVLSSLVSSLINNYVLSNIEASKMSVFANLGTVISIFAGVIFLNENLYYYHIIGSIFIIGGVLGVNFSENIKFKRVRYNKSTIH